MKKLLIFSCCIIFAASCSRRVVPSKPNTTVENNNGNYNNEMPGSDNSGVVVDSATVAPVSSSLVMVVADGYGRLITAKDSLPQNAAVQYNSLQLSKGFTVQERANLQARYKTVPPRVLYVPQEHVSNSMKGSYYIYRKKFWYWKKSDGLFYLDEKYYL